MPQAQLDVAQLAGFGSRAWLEGLLDPERILTDAYFGATEHRTGRMARFVTRGIPSYIPEQREQLRKVMWAISAEAELPAQAAADAAAASEIAEGRALLAAGEIDCARCHTLDDVTDGDEGPVLTGWGSRAWMLGMIHDPGDEAFYGADNDRMPAFGVEQILGEEEMGLIVDWLRGDWYEPEASREH